METKTTLKQATRLPIRMDVRDAELRELWFSGRYATVGAAVARLNSIAGAAVAQVNSMAGTKQQPVGSADKDGMVGTITVDGWVYEILETEEDAIA